ncbi:hypothetical protein [Streptomyces gibsoniae]|uniref:Uncharacterized protein n=1 Tax=Streptomyces gibsoniae TaxID=3075529 RepID=A0ABU2U9K0_9ACTN|nr:hypothetical protein [Streptomyces sp. DSM 41699]MDT0469926.1 hypothetical protein [Streptomyces sp. DSM 41699]
MPQNIVLVVGNASTSADLADLTAFAFDVADRLQVPARVATSMDYDVKDYTGVVLSPTWLDWTPSVVLGVEAQKEDMFVGDTEILYSFEPTKRCGHCGEDDDEAAPVLVGDTWTVSVCPGCVTTAAGLALPGALAVAA